MYFPLKLPENKQFDVVGFGTNAVDYLIIVPVYPEYDSKIELTDYQQSAGGEIATTTAGLCRLGLKTAYVGRFGDDPEGHFGLKTLREEGVDVEHAELIDGARTQIAFIVIDERTGERTVIWKRDSRLSYSPAEVPLEIGRICKVLHFTPHDAHACIALAREAKSHGSVISIDIDNIFDGIEELLPLVDVFVSSAAFPERLVGIADHETALREIKSRYGCAVAGMTLGETGSLLLCDDKLIRTDGFAVPGGCRDTTGAGDSFRVGLLYGLIAGETVEVSARMANAVAALKCRAVGARTSLPSRSELESFLGGTL